MQFFGNNELALREDCLAGGLASTLVPSTAAQSPWTNTKRSMNVSCSGQCWAPQLARWTPQGPEEPHFAVSIGLTQILDPFFPCGLESMVKTLKSLRRDREYM